VVGEEEERRRRRPLLPHEEERRLRRAQEQHRGGAVRGGIDLVVQALAEGAVADLVVVLQEEDEAPRLEARGVRPARAAEVLGALALVKNQPSRSVVARSATVPEKSR
jgi:hypothetical protein